MCDGIAGPGSGISGEFIYSSRCSCGMLTVNGGSNKMSSLFKSTKSI